MNGPGSKARKGTAKTFETRRNRRMGGEKWERKHREPRTPGPPVFPSKSRLYRRDGRPGVLKRQKEEAEIGETKEFAAPSGSSRPPRFKGVSPGHAGKLGVSQEEMRI